MNLSHLRSHYRRTLLEDVVPFWERYAIDANGAITTCIRDDGQVVSRDRWCWSQWRAVWVFSKLYNDVAAEPRWLEIAERICAFVQKAGRLENGHWPMVLDADGRIARGYESIFTDGFAIYGLVELWRAAPDEELLKLALSTFRATEAALASAELPPLHPYPAPPDPTAMAHGLSMMFSLTYHELAQATDDPDVRRAADVHHRRVMDTFLRKDRGLVLEWLDRNGNEFPAPAGTIVLPGHAIESMWFQMHVARDQGTSPVLDQAVDVIHRNLEIGWDADYGGLFYAVDADGRADVPWPFADAKLWWPQTEALYGTLLAYEHCRQDWCLTWHEQIREYCYAHYPVEPHGEWRQKLDRRGQPIRDVVALPVKDPFHLPRVLMYCLEALDRLIGQTREAKLQQQG